MNQILTSIRRTPYQSLSAFLILFFTLFLSLMLFVSLTFLNSILSYLETKPQVTVYFQNKAPENQIFKVRDELMSSGKVLNIKYISKNEAFNIYKQLNKDNPLLLEMVSADILPPSLEIYAKKPIYLPEIAEYLKKRLTDVFKPELINRFSRAVIFRNLEPKELVAIANIQLGELGKTLGEQGISIRFDESVAAYVVKLGYDPAFGARPIRRVIEEKFRSALAEKILRKEIDKGSEVTASIENDQLVFRGG